MRQLVIDTETTGLDVTEGHRIIEIACIELNDRVPTGAEFHEYVNPERIVEQEALKIHGIDNDFLSSKPKFSEIAQNLFEFMSGAELIIHNAPFDLSFLNFEFSQSSGDYPEIESVCEIEDTLEIARQLRPGRRNSLDALANQFDIDLVSERVMHGALLDAKILVEVYRAMTGGQISFEFGEVTSYGPSQTTDAERKRRDRPIEVVVLAANEEEMELHERWLDYLDEKSNNGSIWRKYEVSMKQD